MNKTLFAAAFAAGALVAAPAHSQVRISEWMYSGAPGEYIEFTNLGAASVDFTGWSYDDDSRTPGVFSLSGFGTVQPGESVVITEADAAAFRAAWSLPASVKVLGGYTNNLGRNDEINLFDAGNALVDRLTYGDQSIAGSIRTQDFGGNPGPGALGANSAALWVLASVGDGFGSYASTAGTVGNPGLLVPEPETYAMLLAGLAVVTLVARRRLAAR